MYVFVYSKFPKLLKYHQMSCFSSALKVSFEIFWCFFFLFFFDGCTLCFCVCSVPEVCVCYATLIIYKKFFQSFKVDVRHVIKSSPTDILHGLPDTKINISIWSPHMSTMRMLSFFDTRFVSRECIIKFKFLLIFMLFCSSKESNWFL